MRADVAKSVSFLDKAVPECIVSSIVKKKNQYIYTQDGGWVERNIDYGYILFSTESTNKTVWYV